MWTEGISEVAYIYGKSELASRLVYTKHNKEGWRLYIIIRELVDSLCREGAVILVVPSFSTHLMINWFAYRPHKVSIMVVIFMFLV